jgi:methylated-DNA-[protein]-cysteine S-methyltransferase
MKFWIIENNILVKIDWCKTESLVKSVTISMNPGSHEEAGSQEKSVTTLLSQIRSYLKGKTGGLSIDLLDLRLLSPFAKKVLCELRNSVPAGKTISYGELANLAGHPGAARAVGSVMRNNPFPLFLPCHRVIKSNGNLGWFQGCREGGGLKKYLLDLERK